MNSADNQSQISSRVFTAILGAALAAVFAIEIHGFSTTSNLFPPDIWQPDGWKRFLHFSALFVLVSVPLMVLVPWSYTGLVVALAAIATALAAGPMALLAVILFLTAAGAVGALLLGRAKETSLPSQALAVMIGTAVYIFLMTLAARLPINYPLVWAALLLAPIAWDWPGVRARASAFADWLRAAELRSWGERAAAATLVFILAMHWLVAMKPEISADGLAMHLAVPMNLAANHRLTFEPARFIWSVMPMGADWIYSIVFQWGGEAASRLIDFSMLLAIVCLLYGTARRWLSRAPALLVCALFASTPMVQLVTGSLFVENTLAALVLAMLVASWRLGDTGDRRYLFGAALLGGAALTTKFGALAFVALAIPLAAVELWRVRRQVARPAAAGALAILILLISAAPTYAIAWRMTGNPLFPFLNQKFPSPLLDPKADTLDHRYHDPISLRMPYDLTFQTANYYEARNGSFGFQYFGMLLLVVAGLAAVRSRPATGAALVALAASIVILHSTSNARYAYAAMPLVTIAFAAVMGWTARHSRLLLCIFVIFCTAWIALNVYFLPASGWYHRDFYSPYMFSRHGTQRYLERTAPERLVIQHYSQAHPGSSILMAADTNIADARGDIFENSWHQWGNAIAIQQTTDAADLTKLFDRWHVQYFVAPDRSTGVVLQPPWLRDFLDRCTATEYDLAGYALSRMTAACGAASAKPQPGVFDDFAAALHYDGAWEHNRSFDGPFRYTISFTDSPGAVVRFAFTGHAVTYVFTRSKNRGIAEVLIDGASQGEMDLYAPQTHWQSRRTITVPEGQHTIEIRATGRKSAASSGTFVDVDEFVVE